MHPSDSKLPCPCGSGSLYKACCGPFISGQAKPATAEALMRSRYCAYTLLENDYLRRTWHPKSCPSNLQTDPDARWLGLAIKATVAGSEHDQNGEVEFVARFKVAGRGFRLHERSRFQRLHGDWVYVDGTLIEKSPRRRK